jgi:hypothetical protein
MFNDGSKHVDSFLVLSLKATTSAVEYKLVPLMPILVNSDGGEIRNTILLKPHPPLQYLTSTHLSA